jgi:hypothetical protein
MIEGILLLLALCTLFLLLRPADGRAEGCGGCAHADAPGSCGGSCPVVSEAMGDKR